MIRRRACGQIFGTSAYKNGYRATVFQPVTEAGWGILRGFGKAMSVRPTG